MGCREHRPPYPLPGAITPAGSNTSQNSDSLILLFLLLLRDGFSLILLSVFSHLYCAYADSARSSLFSGIKTVYIVTKYPSSGAFSEDVQYLKVLGTVHCRCICPTAKRLAQEVANFWVRHPRSPVS